MRLEEAATLEGLFAVAPVGLAVFGTDLRYVRINAALAEINGRPVGAHLGRRPSEVLGAGGDAVEELLRRVLTTGQRAPEGRIDVETAAQPGVLRSFAATFFAVHDAAGAVAGAAVLVREVTDAVRAQVARDRLLARSRLLAEVSAAVDASLDYDATLATVADLAVRGIADWCAIDLPDGAGGVRNVAVAHIDPERVAFARRLSERYPADPDSPTGAANVLRTGVAELYPELPEELLRASARDAEHLELILALGIRSAMVVPLRARGRTLGALTLIRTTVDASYDEDDLALATDIAQRAALAVDNARLYRDAGQQRDRYEAILHAQSELGEAFVLIRDERIVFANAATERLLRRPAAELEALGTFYDVLPAERHHEVRARVARAGGGQGAQRFETEVLRADGVRVAVEVGARATAEEDGLRLVVIARDITERKLQEAERERLLAVEQAARRAGEAAHARVRLLADASGLLERSLGLEGTVQEVAELVVQRVADACAIDVAGPQATLRRVAAHARSERRAAELWALGREPAPRADDDHPLARALRGTEAVELQGGGGHDDGGDPASRLTQVLGARGLVLPLVARGRAVGTLALGWDAGADGLDAQDRSLLGALAQRIALAVDSAEQYRERAYVARTLQTSLLPRSLPAIEGAELAAQYLAGGEGMQVGGDFYDVFELGPDTWALVIGDVCGKGAEAAGVTGLARYTLRALADARLPPADTLRRLNAELLRQSPDQRFLSAVLARLTLAGGGRARLELACGGHPAPVVLRAGAGAGAEALACTGTLLGVDPGAAAAELVVELGPGDGVVLYTDGITEADRRRPLSPGELAEQLAPMHADGAAEVARRVVRIAQERAGDVLHDDVAVLVARTTLG